MTRGARAAAVAVLGVGVLAAAVVVAPVALTPGCADDACRVVVTASAQGASVDPVDGACVHVTARGRISARRDRVALPGRSLERYRHAVLEDLTVDVEVTAGCTDPQPAPARGLLLRHSAGVDHGAAEAALAALVRQDADAGDEAGGPPIEVDGGRAADIDIDAPAVRHTSSTSPALGLPDGWRNRVGTGAAPCASVIVSIERSVETPDGGSVDGLPPVDLALCLSA